jgi:hypothetical protein
MLRFIIGFVLVGVFGLTSPAYADLCATGAVQSNSGERAIVFKNYCNYSIVVHWSDDDFCRNYACATGLLGPGGTDYEIHVHGNVLFYSQRWPSQ